MTTLLALSIAIMAGLLVSRFIKLVHMPNVTAFLIGGLLIGPSVLGILSQEMTDSLSIITEAALGFIAYSIGAEFKLSYLKRIGTKPVVITICEGLGAVLYVGTPLVACACAGQLVLGVANGAIMPVRVTLTQRSCGIERLGSVSALMRVALSSAGTLPLLAAPFLADAFGVQPVLVVASASVAVAGAALLAASRRVDD